MNYIKTKHFVQRSQGRSIRDFVFSSLINYGSGKYSKKGFESVYFDENALDEIRHSEPEMFKKIEKYKNAYIIIHQGNLLVTAARAH